MNSYPNVLACCLPPGSGRLLGSGDRRCHRYPLFHRLDPLIDKGLHLGDVLRLEMGKPALNSSMYSLTGLYFFGTFVYL